MDIERRVGRIVGALFLAQMVGSAVLNFRLESPLFGEPGFLVNAAPHAQQIGASALLGLALGALFSAIAITVFPIVRAHSESMALWLFVFGAVGLALAAVEHASVMSMVSVSHAYANAATGAGDQFMALRVVVASARNWVHYVARLLDGTTLLVFYLALFRLSLVPRALAVFGLVAGLLQISGIAVVFFGHDVVFPLLAPMGLAQLALSVWLLIKGFVRQADSGVPM
jgi:hypothetical protein